MVSWCGDTSPPPVPAPGRAPYSLVVVGSHFLPTKRWRSKTLTPLPQGSRSFMETYIAHLWMHGPSAGMHRPTGPLRPLRPLRPLPRPKEYRFLATPEFSKVSLFFTPRPTTHEGRGPRRERDAPWSLSLESLPQQ